MCWLVYYDPMNMIDEIHPTKKKFKDKKKIF